MIHVTGDIALDASGKRLLAGLAGHMEPQIWIFSSISATFLLDVSCGCKHFLDVIRHYIVAQWRVCY